MPFPFGKSSKNFKLANLLEDAELALPHRMRRKSFDDETLEFTKIEEIVREEGGMIA